MGFYMRGPEHSAQSGHKKSPDKSGLIYFSVGQNFPGNLDLWQVFIGI
jgi:hypothetical protein